MTSLISSIASTACSLAYATIEAAPAAWLVAASMLLVYAWIFSCEH